MELDERFATGELDPAIWLPHYLPHWATRAGSAATWDIGPDGLVLRIPEEQPLWAPDQHREPLRVSCIRSGERGDQQPFLAMQQVREPQPTFWGYTPLYGRVEVRMRMRLSPRSMAAFWTSGVEETREQSGEICVAEIFGDTDDWAPGSLLFTIDGVEVRRLAQSPDHPVQLMIGVFDFPAKATADDLVAHVRGASLPG